MRRGGNEDRDQAAWKRWKVCLSVGDLHGALRDDGVGGARCGEGRREGDDVLVGVAGMSARRRAVRLCARVAVVLGCQIYRSRAVVAGCVAGGGGTGEEAE